MAAQESRHSHRDARGFTLIELMVTVAVVAILAAIALPSYKTYVMRGNRAAAKGAMMDIANREQQYLLANRSYADKTALTNNGYVLESEVSSSYDWTLTADNTVSPPTFLITFIAKGTQSSDGNLTLNSVGTKTPADKWVR